MCLIRQERCNRDNNRPHYRPHFENLKSRRSEISKFSVIKHPLEGKTFQKPDNVY